jgi:hypothetical protein
MNQEDIIKLAREVGLAYGSDEKPLNSVMRFAAFVAEHERNACVQIIEEYRIPVGNSRSGELAYEWTYAALKEIRDDIRVRGNND